MTAQEHLEEVKFIILSEASPYKPEILSMLCDLEWKVKKHDDFMNEDLNDLPVRMARSESQLTAIEQKEKNK